MKLTSLILIIFLTISVKAQNCCEFKAGRNISIIELGQEFQRLKNINDRKCCNNFGSGLMNIMEMLHDSLDLGVSESKIVNLMGAPDKFASKDYPVEHHFINLKEGERVLIYFWRGMHDFLYFGIKDDKLIYKNWYYALE